MANRQLEEIYEEIQQRFSRHPAVSITPLEGDPPEKYQITYTITGLQKIDGDAEPSKSEEHSITITIPFGFPHFPPSCVPESPVFHPDFDPAAICIGEFWTPDKKLTDLIVHIGQLISGEQFSTENAFNEEAASWYLLNSDQLPHATFPVDAVLEEDLAATSEDGFEDTTDDLELDVIDDIDLEDDFSYLSIEETSFDETSQEPPPLETAPTAPAIDYDLIELLKSKKRYQKLNEYLHSLSGNIEFDQKKELLDLTDKELQKAQQLYGEAETFEHEGNPVNSLQKYKEVKKHVSDFPGLDEDIKRAEQSVELLGGFDQSESVAEEEVAEPAKQAEPAPQEPDKKKKEVTLFEDKENSPLRNYIPYTIGGALLVCLLGVGFVYYINTNRYSEAEEKYAQCQNSLKKRDFYTTDKLCNEALTSAQKIRYLKTGQRDQLVGKINTTLSSQILKQGLAGNVKYNDRYISISAFESIEQFNKLVSNGEKAYEEGTWRLSSDYLSQAIEIGTRTPDIDRELLAPLEEKLIRSNFNAAYEAGVALTKQQSWQEASKELTVAARALTSLDPETQNKYKIELDRLHQEALYHSLTTQADIHFESGQWDKVISSCKEILLKSRTFLESHPEYIRQLEEKIIRAELYSTIEAGKKAFSNSNWDLAIQKYNSAISLLNENKQALSQVSSEENRKKLSRIRLQASIIRDQQQATIDLKKKLYKNALENFENIITAIEESPFGVEEEFFLVLEDTRKSIQSTRDEMFIADKTQYLEENYVDLFLQNFPAATTDSLSEPKIEYVKKVEEKLLFKLECLETGGGRPLRLVINYLFDPATDKWSFYNP